MDVIGARSDLGFKQNSVCVKSNARPMTRCTSSRRAVMMIAVTMIVAVTFATLFPPAHCAAVEPNRSAGRSPMTPVRVAAPADPRAVLGDQACVKCHTGEVRVWRDTPHAKTFKTLHRSREAAAIAQRLGLRSIKHEGRCASCHYTSQSKGRSAAAAMGPHDVIAGVSCESCHGAARDWLDIHHDYGGEGVTRWTESPSHRADRIARSVAAGMRNPHNVFAMAQACLRCHTTGDETLVNVGGHTAGSLNFEMVSWSQGSVRHNFARDPDGRNAVESPERMRVMFVAGLIAEFEAGLRATAAATRKDTFGMTVAQRTQRSAKRMQNLNRIVSSPHLREVLEIWDAKELRLNNREPLLRAADRIAEIGYRFAEETNGESLAALDPYIPGRDSYK